MNAHNHPIHTVFADREAICDTCDGNPWFGIGHGSRCESCEGTGEVPAMCCGCNRVVPLDDEGECRQCAEPFLDLTVTKRADGSAGVAA
jgi:RecJ-like exonuclease